MVCPIPANNVGDMEWAKLLPLRQGSCAPPSACVLAFQEPACIVEIGVWGEGRRAVLRNGQEPRVVAASARTKDVHTRLVHSPGGVIVATRKPGSSTTLASVPGPRVQGDASI